MIARGVVLQPENSIDIEPGVVTLYDQSRYHNHGAMTDVTMVQLPSGLWVMSFNGASSLVNCGNDASLDFIGDITLEGWVNLDASHSSLVYFIGKRDGANIAWYIVFQPSGILTLTGGGGGSINTPAALTFSVWHYLVAVVLGANGYIYVDGEEISNGAVALASQPTVRVSLGIRWAGYPAASFFFVGLQAMHRIRNYALTAGQVLNRYENTKHWFGIN